MAFSSRKVVPEIVAVKAKSQVKLFCSGVSSSSGSVALIDAFRNLYFQY